MSQLLVGFNKYPDMRGILVKGAEKAFEDSQKKFKSAKSIENFFEEPDSFQDFFEVIYEKFESEIDQFFEKKICDVQEVNSFYKLKTKYLDRKLKGLQSLVVK